MHLSSGSDIIINAQTPPSKTADQVEKKNPKENCRVLSEMQNFTKFLVYRPYNITNRVEKNKFLKKLNKSNSCSAKIEQVLFCQNWNLKKRNKSNSCLKFKFQFSNLKFKFRFFQTLVRNINFQNQNFLPQNHDFDCEFRIWDPEIYFQKPKIDFSNASRILLSYIFET